MRFRVLGPLRVWDGTSWSPVPAPQQRVVLAVLLAEPGRTVSTDRLVDEVWGERPPPAAVSALRNYIHRLRRLLAGGSRLVTGHRGYELAVDGDDLDADGFRRLVDSARGRLAAGRIEAAVTQLTDALELWRGPAMADVPASPTVTAWATGLEQHRLAGTERLMGLQLDLGRHQDIADELDRLVEAHPLREQLHAQRVLALYRCGRRGEALAAYRQARLVLVDELGVEPGPELRELHRAVLAGDPRPAAPPVPGPAQLPPDVTGFAGRRAALDQLDSTAAIAVVSGTAGVGKTALAVHWGHRMAGRFPDGQLYVNLRGFDPSGEAAPPTTALRGFLEALGVAPRQVPSDLDAQVGLYRTRLAAKRVLVVLDNARDAAQVRPLLPGGPTCLAVVTSRHQLTGLVASEGARPVVLDLLSGGEARELLGRRLGASRIAAEPAAVDEIITRCARLPLALAIAAARAATHPTHSLATLAAQLAATSSNLDGFATGDPTSDVRVVFSWSYRSLTTTGAQLFRLLGLHPGPSTTVPAAASLAGLPVARILPALAELTGARLITEHTPGRYALHDLLRTYASELAHTLDPADVRLAARHRVLDHYLQTACAAARLLQEHRHPIAVLEPRPGVSVPDLADHDGAMAWFDAEYHVLLAAIAQAAGTGFDTHAWQLAWSLGDYLHRRGHWREWAGTQQVALDAATRRGEPAAQAHAHRALGLACTWLSRIEEAYLHYRQALELYEQLGDLMGLSRTRCNLAGLLDREGRYGDALSHAQQALDLSRAAGDRTAEATALNVVGWGHAQLGDYRQALGSCRQALALYQETADRPGQASTWHSLGYAHLQLGEHRPAVDCLRHALRLSRQVGNRHIQTKALNDLGDAHHALGDTGAARAAWRTALAILEQLGHEDADRVRAKLLD
jgi:DNA-binding SARP family transcriptional activator/tetratricopeptide (TPR) repeat protein